MLRRASILVAVVAALAGCSAPVEGSGTFDARPASGPVTSSPSIGDCPNKDRDLPSDGVAYDGRFLPDSPRGLPLEPGNSGVWGLDDFVARYPAGQQAAARAALLDAGFSQGGQRTWGSGTDAAGNREADVLGVLAFRDPEGACRFVRGQIAAGFRPLGAADLPGAVGLVTPGAGNGRIGFAMLSRSSIVLSVTVVSSRQPVDRLSADLLRAAYTRL